MSRTQTATMPYTQPPQRYCRDCQYCDDCDPMRKRPADVPRICNNHRQRMRFVETDQITAANHKCSEGATPGARPSSAQQQGYPQAASNVQSPQDQVAQHPQSYTTGPGSAYGNNPAGQYPNSQYGVHGNQPRSSYGDHRDNAGRRDLYQNFLVIENARAHIGRNCATDRSRLGATYRDNVVGGDTVTHFGDNVGYPEMETERLAKIPHLPKDNGHIDYRDRYNDQNDQ